MKKTRVKEGEMFWWINSAFQVCSSKETDGYMDEMLFNHGNYFSSEKEAESIVRKLNAILKGADVIKMPSGEELMKAKIERFRKSGFSDSFDPYDIFYGGFVDCYDFFKSKIVK